LELTKERFISTNQECWLRTRLL